MKVVEVIRLLMREAIEFHLEGLAKDSEPAPEAHSTAGYALVEVG